MRRIQRFRALGIASVAAASLIAIVEVLSIETR